MTKDFEIPRRLHNIVNVLRGVFKMLSDTKIELLVKIVYGF